MNNTNTDTTQITEPAGEQPAAPPDIGKPDSEAERLRAENTELKISISLRRAEDRITRMLTGAGARSPGLLFAAVKDRLQFSDDGEPQNAAALAAQLRENYPEQFGIQTPAGSIDGGAGSAGRPPFISAETLARMTPSEIQKLDWQEVRRVLNRR